MENLSVNVDYWGWMHYLKSKLKTEKLFDLSNVKTKAN